MSVYGLFEPNKNPKDPKALKNNPPIGPKKIRDKEIVKKSCGDGDCKTKICPPGKPCVSPFIEEKAIANTTHGTKDTANGKNEELHPTQDYSGNNKSQRAVFYKDAHDASSSTEIPHGTNFINKPDVANIIKKYEDKK